MDDILIGTTRQNIANLAVLTLGVIGITVLLVWAVREQRAKARPQMWWILAAAVLAILGDAGARMLTGLQSRPGADGVLLYRAFDVDIAIWMGFAFCPYIGFAGYLTFQALIEGRPRSRIWGILAVGTAIDVAGEYLMIHLGDLYYYRGAQPLKLFGLPLVWPMAFVATPMLIGATLAVLTRRVRGAAWLLTLPLLSSGYIAFLAALTWPVMVARTTGMNQPLLDAVGVLGIGCMLATLYLITLFLPARSGSPPRRPQERHPHGRIEASR
jgi:hypothetical protein